MPCVPGGEITLEGEIARNWFSETLAVKKYVIRFYAASSGGSVLSSETLSPPACSRSVLASYAFSVIAPASANYFTLQLADNAAQDNVTVVSYDTDGIAPIPGDTPAPIVPQEGDPGTSVRASRCDHKHEYHHPIAAEIDYENDDSGLTAENVQTAIDELAASGGGGAPTTVDYLVGTASGSLSAEIVVGTSPGGELGGTWASPTVDSVHSGSAHLAIGSGSGDAAAGNHTHTAVAPSFVSIAKWGTD
jgi:hypothetical protein